MSEIAVIVLMMVWMGLGGFIFAKIPKDGLGAEAVAFGFILCLVLAPALFGFWLANRPEKAPAPNTEA